MPANKKFFRRNLTIAETLVWLLILAAGLGLLCALNNLRVRSKAERDLRSAIPKLCQELDQQRRVLVSAIEAYKGSLGFYPPDHRLDQAAFVVEPITNQLMYELFGTLHEPEKDTFVPAHYPAIRRVLVKEFFNAEGFKNSAEKPELVRHFLDSSNLISTAMIHDKPEEVGLPSFWPNWEGIEPSLFAQISAGTWHYNCSAPNHNPGTYDLWIEVKTPLTNIVIGNW